MKDLDERQATVMLYVFADGTSTKEGGEIMDKEFEGPLYDSGVTVEFNDKAWNT